MAKKRSRRRNPRHHRVHHRRARRNNPVRVVYRYKARRKNSRRRRGGMRSRNPMQFRSGGGAVQTAKSVAAGLVGVYITKTIPALLPASLTSSPIMKVIASAATAWLAGYGAEKMLGRDLGSAVMFGGFMQAGSVALNTFVPSIGSVIGLSGLRGLTPSNDILLPYNMFSGMSAKYAAGGRGSIVRTGPGTGFAPAFA